MTDNEFLEAQKQKIFTALEGPMKLEDRVLIISQLIGIGIVDTPHLANG